MMLQWHFKKFEELSTLELYQILQFRQTIFVVEQDCAYLDADGKDFKAIHLCGLTESNDLMAYARILLPIAGEKAVHLGRICTHDRIRKTGIGKELMQQALGLLAGMFPKHQVVISAQLHLQAFYHAFGFKSQGRDYLEDGIPHIRMVIND